MPKHSVAAGCSTANGEGYIAYINFLKTRHYMRNGPKPLSVIDGPTASSVLCSKQDCFIMVGVRYREDMGIPAEAA